MYSICTTTNNNDNNNNNSKSNSTSKSNNSNNNQPEIQLLAAAMYSIRINLSCGRVLAGLGLPDVGRAGGACMSA